MRVPTTRQRVAAAVAGALALVTMLSGCSADAHVDIDVPAQADAAFSDELTQQLQDAVTNAMITTGASGAVVGVWAPWSGSLVTGVGTASFSDPTPVTADMQFRAGQLTRPMVCDVLFALAEEGIVGLDDPVTDWVSGVPDLSDISLVELCDSTSGIGSYTWQLFNSWLINPTRVWNPRELASYGLGQPRAGEPGTAYRSSDAGYVLLGVALERASGRSAAALLQQYVFDPLDMTSTRLPAGKAAAPSTTGEVLTGHHSFADASGAMNCTDPLDITTFSSSTGFTDSGVVSTIGDLGRYAQALASGALAADDSTRFDAPIALASDSPSWYTTSGGAIHAGSLTGGFGSVPGYATAAFADPSSGLTVAVVLNNSARGGEVAEYLAWELAALASKAPATGGNTMPDAGLPWTAQQYRDAVNAGAICSTPAS